MSANALVQLQKKVFGKKFIKNNYKLFIMLTSMNE